MVLINIVVVLVLVAANAFFVACEFSLVAVRPTRVQELRQAGDARANVVAHLLRDLDRILSGVQLGITMASLALGWLGELTLAHLLEPLLLALGTPWATAVAHSISVAVAFLFITTMHVVLGELVPKSAALQRAERVALLIARPMAAFMLAFRPFINFFDGASNVILRVMGYREATGHALVRSTEEFRVLLGQVEQHGVLDPREAARLEGALEMGRVEVRQVMVPRAAIVGIPASATLEQVLETIHRHRFSRYPVYEGSLEQVTGVLFARDLFRYLGDRAVRADRDAPGPTFELRQFVREAVFVPETRVLEALLEDFRGRHRQMALVVDEFGSVQGMVTLADLVETIVGEVREEHQVAPVPQMLVEGGMVVDGRTSLHDLGHQHEIELPSGPGFETLAGFVINRLGFIPQGGESFLHDGLRVTVLEMEGRRVARVKLERIARASEGADDD